VVCYFKRESGHSAGWKGGVQRRMYFNRYTFQDITWSPLIRIISLKGQGQVVGLILPTQLSQELGYR
jgi:hypothetical protein